MLKFKTTKVEQMLIEHIATKFYQNVTNTDINYPRLDLTMDLSAAHSNGCKIDFHKLLDADIGTLGHDILGIRRYIDRKTGKLTQCFVPRCALGGR